MHLQWNGPRNRIRRVRGTGYEWNRDNGFTTKVQEQERIAELLTLPNDEFTVHPDDEVCAAVPPDRVVFLVMGGIVTLAGLAAATKGKVKELARLGVGDEETVSAWASKARDLLEEKPSSTADTDSADSEKEE